jgi:autotransporter-associated beta strand protein
MRTHVVRGFRAATLAAVLAAPAAHAGGATCTWTGAAGAVTPLWSAPANWDACGGAHPVPADGDTVQFLAGALGATSTNDISGLDLVELRLFAPFAIDGQGITLQNGVVVNISSGASSPSLSLPITGTAAAPLVLSCSGGVTLDVASPLSLPSDLVVDTSCRVLLSGTSVGLGGLTKVGAGTLELTGPKGYSGTTTIVAGTLELTGNATLGGAQAPAHVRAGASLVLVDAGPIGGELHLAGDGGGAGALRHVGGTHVVSGPVVLDSATTVNAMADALNVLGPVHGAASLTKVGAGTLALAGSNTYTGQTTVAGGVLLVASANALGPGGLTVVEPDGSLEVMGNYIGTDALSLAGNGAQGAGALRLVDGSVTWSGPITLAADATIANVSGGDLTLTGPVGGSAGFTKTGTGRLILNASNTYSGTTVVNQGVLRLTPGATAGAPGGAGGPSGGTLVASGAELEIEGPSSLAETITLAGDPLTARATFRGGVHVASGDLNATGFARIEVEDGVVTFTGATGGSAPLVKTGAGTLALNGASTYTGTTTVAGGTLQVGGATGAVDVAAGARLVGNGTAGAITVRDGGTLAPTGTLVADSLTWHGGGVVEFELGASGAGADRLQLAGALLRGDGAGFVFRFADAATGEPQPGVAYVLANYASTTFVDDDFSHTYNGVPGTSSLRGAFFVEPDRLEFEVETVSMFFDGFE